MNNFCVKCGHKLEDDSSFCSNCGTTVNADSTPDVVVSSASTQNTTPISSTTTYEYNPYVSNDNPMSTSYIQPQKKNNNRLLIIGAIVVVLCVVIVGGVFAFYYLNDAADVNTSSGVSQSWTDAYIYGDLLFGIENNKDYVEATIGNEGSGGNVVIYATATQNGKIYTQSQTLHFNSGERRNVRFVFSETDVNDYVDYRMWIGEFSPIAAR
jgi:uncharacterized membrane protein YvbJ